MSWLISLDSVVISPYYLPTETNKQKGVREMSYVGCHSLVEVGEVMSECKSGGFKCYARQLCAGHWEVRFWR